MLSPRIKLLTSFAFGLFVVIYSLIFFEGSAQFYRLWYYAPAAIVVGAFLVDRINQGFLGKLPLALDLIVATCCLMRPLLDFPPFSGHAVFSVYALLTCSPWFTKILAAILLGITLYAKLVLWKGDPTLIPGLLVGCGAALAYRILIRKFPSSDKTVPKLPL